MTSSGPVLRLLSLLLFVASPAFPAEPADHRADARSVEALINEKYAYLERLSESRFSLTGKLKAEAEAVSSRRELVRFTERSLMLLADHHAITGASLNDSWAVFPSYGDLWVVRRGGDYLIEQVRDNSPAELAGVRSGDRLIAVNGVPTDAAVAEFWAELGTTGGGERDSYAARLLAAGKRDRQRQLTVQRGSRDARTLLLPNLYAPGQPERPVLAARGKGRDLVIRFHDSLGNSATIKAFDEAMAGARKGQRVILDLTDTPGGGNSTIARAILGWFVAKPKFYQMHDLPAEERATGIPRRWVEQVLPRRGKYHAGPVKVRVGRWTGSMGEGLASGFDAIGACVEGTEMAGLLGAIYDHRLPQSNLVVKLPTERLFAVGGTPREQFVPNPMGKC